MMLCYAYEQKPASSAIEIRGANSNSTDQEIHRNEASPPVSLTTMQPRNGHHHNGFHSQLNYPVTSCSISDPSNENAVPVLPGGLETLHYPHMNPGQNHHSEHGISTNLLSTQSSSSSPESWSSKAPNVYPGFHTAPCNETTPYLKGREWELRGDHPHLYHYQTASNGHAYHAGHNSTTIPGLTGNPNSLVHPDNQYQKSTGPYPGLSNEHHHPVYIIDQMNSTQQRIPYDWINKHSYTPAQPPVGKTRTKDKYRVVYSDHQRLELEKEFHFSKYITIRRKSELATQLNLSERQIKIWFQNRRAKERKNTKKQLGEGSSMVSDSFNSNKLSEDDEMENNKILVDENNNKNESNEIEFKQENETSYNPENTFMAESEERNFPFYGNYSDEYYNKNHVEHQQHTHHILSPPLADISVD